VAKKQLGDLDFEGVSKLLNLPDPTSPQEPGTKSYIDTMIATALLSLGDLDGGTPDSIYNLMGSIDGGGI
jgi:hypothetical protein